MSVLTLEAKLERQDPSTPWGFRMQGGKDFNTPLAIQRVNPSSLADKCGLLQGDIILKIGNVSVETLKHKDAQDTILSYGNKLDLLLHRGGQPNQPSYDKFSAPMISSQQQNQAPSNQTAPVFGVSYNAKPKPFGTTADNLTQQTQNLSISSKPDYHPSVEKYTEVDDRPNPAQHQSKSFKYLQDAINSGQEIKSALKPLPNTNSHRRSPSPNSQSLVNRQYNNPVGLYSANNVSSTFESSKVMLDSSSNYDTEQSDVHSQGKKVYQPSETFKLVHEKENTTKEEPTHSRSFKFLQQQLTGDGVSSVPKASSVPKPGVWSPGVGGGGGGSAAPAAKPYQPVVQPPPPPPPAAVSAPVIRGPPPKPTGVGAVRGKKGDAMWKKPDSAVGGKIPVCASCGSPIRGPFVVALGKTWCPDHFTCANPRCGVKLVDIGFVEESGFLYCEKDYAENFAPHCSKCSKAIIGECVNALSQAWHPQCFTCAHCHKPISGGQFHLEEGKAYCEYDWKQMFQTMCHGCSYPIEPGDRWVEAMGHNYHSECFNCATCQINLEGQPFVPRAGNPYCKKHAR